MHCRVVTRLPAGSGPSRWTYQMTRRAQMKSILSSVRVASATSPLHWKLSPRRCPSSVPQTWAAATLASPAAYKASPSSEAVTREALGRATWTLLHTLGAQFPDRPTRRQRRAARQLIAALGDVYPCASCASHWGDVLAELGPPRTGSGEALRAYLCAAHNVVNRSLGKGVFDCAGGALASRWGYREGEVGYAPLCGEEGADVCALQGRR